MMHQGALGYTTEMPFEMLLRGLLSYVVGAEGGANIMKIVINREFVDDESIPYRRCSISPRHQVRTNPFHRRTIHVLECQRKTDEFNAG